MLDGLSDYVAKRMNETRGLATHDYSDNEMMICSIMDYISSCGEFRGDDLKYLYDHGFCAGDFLINDDCDDEVVQCAACGYTSDVEGDVMRADGKCPQCGENAIAVYGKESPMTEDDAEFILAAAKLRDHCKERNSCAGCVFDRWSDLRLEYCALGVNKKPSGWRISDKEGGIGA